MACLSMAPRHAAHTALTRPDAYLAGGIPRGRHPGQEDACIAYDIFLEVWGALGRSSWWRNRVEIHPGARRAALYSADWVHAKCCSMVCPKVSNIGHNPMVS